MGMSAPSKLTSPSRPFHRDRAETITSFRSTTVLQQLILCQEWQRVLIRARLFPHELSRRVEVVIDGIPLKVLPLHLVCALDPPHAVVRLFLELYVDASISSIRPVSRRLHRYGDFWGATKRRLHRVVIRRRKMSSWPDTEPEGDQYLLVPKPDNDSFYFTARESLHDDAVNLTDDESSMHLGSSVSTESLNQKSVILQLGSSGTLLPLPRSGSTSAADSNSSSGGEIASLYRLQWDINSLRREVAKYGSLLPLHIACFYRASPDTLQALLNACPLAALSDVLGMLPIHWISCGCFLPPLLPSTAAPLSSFVPGNPPTTASQSAYPLRALFVLKNAVPESIRVQSGSHLFTPRQYIQECMEDCAYKDKCLQLLEDVVWEADSFSCTESASGDDSSTSSSTSAISLFLDSDISSLCSFPVSGQYVSDVVTRLIEDQKWQSVEDFVRGDPGCTNVWLYGMDADEDTILTVWKRLPIHLACRWNAPVEVLKLIVEPFPGGLGLSDPQTGRLPLHWLVTNPCTLAQVHYLLRVWPEATREVDCSGRTPLHEAVLHGMVAYDVVELLVEFDPDSTTQEDNEGNTPKNYANQSFGADHKITEFLSLMQDTVGILSQG